MLGVSRQLLAIAALLALVLAPKESMASGGYTPCMVQPAFIKPLLSKPLYVHGEVVPPTIVNPEKKKWAIEQPDFELATMVEPVISKPKYDGCAEQASRKLIDQQRTLRKIEGKVLMVPSPTAASRFMQGADDCCGNTAGGR